MESFCLGIDLGTSNSAIAVADSLDANPRVIAIPQVTAPGAVGELPTLASALYLPHAGESDAAPALPWPSGTESPAAVVGHWARQRGAEVPDRVISSAKSWLCHGAIDRKAPLLPWKSESVTEKVSPVEASRRYLEHLIQALRSQQAEPPAGTVLTVPASFDEAARSLTVEAARAAGLESVVLLEEPQAALYAWIAASGGAWRQQLRPGDVVLVVDVGGGTTDFSLIAVSQSEGNLRLERIAVGEHLLLGGDNMDLALAYRLRRDWEADGKALDSWQTLSLVHAVRLAKERLLAADGPAEVPISIAGRGSSLFKKNLSARLSRETASELVVDGFFPLVAATDRPNVRRSVGIQDIGLPFVADPAVSRHLARFLSRSLENVTSDPHLGSLVPESRRSQGFVAPTAILFNGGVFNSPALRERVIAQLGQWVGEGGVRELTGADYDLAVARGAAYYARTLLEDKGVRIKAGTARSYYLGVEPSVPAVPGFEPPIRGLCVVPQGLEEGSEVVLEAQEFGLVTGEPVEFRFFSSSVRAGDKVGTVVEDAERELEESSRLQITLPPLEGKTGEVVPVNLDAAVTEVGTLALRMKHARSDRRWNLEFNVRPTAG
jgi:molecular chaperone DnaK (HSP70)